MAREPSPYLLQHAHNPVDWFPWGEEAFARARTEDKPVFLSVGYSTCHWCHVMARESFEDPRVAAMLNEHFVCVKVDREERPDVDRVYMAFVQATTGSGGWPLNVWLTPDLKPFYGGTYFPPEDRWGRASFAAVLQRIADAWRTQRDRLTASGDDMLGHLREATPLAAGAAPPPAAELPARGHRALKAAYDARHGGFGTAPKFPTPARLRFLLHYGARTGSDDASGMALFTLRRMAAGGIRDHLGGGFHRYSVDAQWQVPHFEKMLYDQAELACAYLDAFQLTGERDLGETARDTLDFVLRDLAGPQGEFYSAEDADSARPEAPHEHAEGAFYLWTRSEVETVLGREAADLFMFCYGVEPDGNVAGDPQGEFRGHNILRVQHSAGEAAERFGQPLDSVRAQLDAARSTLFQRRAQRPRPHRDDKVLTAWNGLMISALARGAQVLDAPRYADAGLRAAAFIRAHLYDADRGVLLRRYRDGVAGIDGYADDYAFLIQGLIDLYESTFDTALLAWALTLQAGQDERFRDAVDGAYFSTASDASDILLRMKDVHDGAEPSTNGVTALNLLRLGELLDSESHRVRAAEVLAACSGALGEAPAALPTMLAALDRGAAAPTRIVIAGRPQAEDTKALLRAVHAVFLPHRTLVLADGGRGQAWLARHTPFLAAVKPGDGRATAYVCAGAECGPPLHAAADLQERLRTQRREQPACGPQ